VQCATCGAESPTGKRFCGECGSPLALACASCGSPLDPGKRFCGDCGTPVSSDLAAPARVEQVAPALAERRVCSVLFCDLVGFTPLSESRDPEDVRELLSRYFDAARAVIARYGGTVEKFIGDAVMAVWGAPCAAEGDAERAVRAALDLVEAVDELGGEINAAGLTARAGVVTGEVAVTIGAVGQGMVAGDAVNTAARVQAAAAPGSVLVDDGTWRVARGSITFADAGEHELKGKAEPLKLWQAGHVVSGAGGNQRIDGLEAPLIGRDAELRLLKGLFHASAERRSARLVSIVGAAGVGKSRLGWEFYKYIDGLATVVAWHRGRCLSYGDGVAFWALAEMVRQRLAIAESDSNEVAAEKLKSGLAELIADTATRDYVRPRLARLLGVDDESGSLSRDELFAGWRTFIEQVAAVDPVVMVVEDLQHADDGLLDFLAHLLDWSRDAPIFVLTLARPELEDRRAGWAAGRRNSTSMSLEPLSDEAMDAMLDGLVSGMPAPAKAAIRAQAQGIPLYAVETVRMLIDRDAVQPIDGVYRLVGDVGQLSVPDTLQSLLAARLDALEPDARLLVADAAVLGGTFPPEAISAISQLEEHDVRRLLDELVRREVLMVRADPLSPERGQYGFVQTLFRQVAYDTLSRRERKARHLLAADHLARVFADEGEEMTEVIAQHLLDALAAVPDDDDAGDLQARAVGALGRAGDRALRAGAPAAAARSFARAADLLIAAGGEANAVAAAGLLEKAATADHTVADYPTSITRYDDAAELYTRYGDDRGAARARTGIARSLRRQGRHDEARHLIRDAVATLREHPDPDAVNALNELTTIEAFAGNVAEAERLITETLEMAQAIGLSASKYADLFSSLGIIRGAGNRIVEAVAAFRESLRIAENSGDGVRQGISQMNLADTLLMQGLWAPSAAGAALAVAALRRTGSALWPFAVGNQVQALLFAGRWDEAAGLIEAAIADGAASDPYLAWMATTLAAMRGDDVVPDWLETIHALASSEDPQDTVTVAIADATIAAHAGNTTAAFAGAMTAIEAGEQVGLATEGIRWGWPLAADAALALDDVAKVEQLLVWADAHPDGHLHPLVRADRLRVRARLAASRGDDGAREMFDAAVGDVRAADSPYHLAICLADQASYLSSVGDADEAQRSRDEAELIAAALGARPLLARIAGVVVT
jgi:class 3 adenylate cyclase/tetratricopeptide (TPR) repeat protein